ncbi:MAG TPA: pitrilysin family protein [Thermoanaerobaculia bacterium]|nr:pitrilysin family protein [Thermoanaerobaculia bacterium]
MRDLARQRNRAAVATVEAPPSVRFLPGTPRVERLANGLTVCLLENRQAPIVTTALFYRAGTRDETPGQGGISHFLEHMMFKGSSRFGPGEIDRLTQALGGSNNAFTSHDLTAYHFNFAADRWTEALAIEADRMAGLTLDPDHVASERQVILEEIAMYDSEPWDALEMEVHAHLFGAHPYGRPVLGTRDDLMGIGADELRAYHRRFYRPDTALLVVAGDIGEGGEEAFAAVEKTFGALPPGGERRAGAVYPSTWPASLDRFERRKGEVARMMLALPAPAGPHPDHPALRLLSTLLAGGRTSRLHRELVEVEQLCAWFATDLSEGLDASLLTLVAEVVPGVEPEKVEERLQAHIDDVLRTPPEPDEVERARQIAVADWVFGHEKVHQQAMSAGMSLALFDPEHIDRYMGSLVATGPEELHEVALRYLRPERSAVLGWSLPSR